MVHQAADVNLLQGHRVQLRMGDLRAVNEMVRVHERAVLPRRAMVLWRRSSLVNVGGYAWE